MPQFEKHVRVNSRYLVLPVKNDAEKMRFQLLHDGQLAREFLIELALSGPPDWWACYDVSQFDGLDLAVVLVDRQITQAEAAFLASEVRLADQIPDSDDLYHERFRPQFHFTPRRGWNNDPNGLIYFAGEWHLFFQYNPFGVGWGNMHWGHAVSRDLLHWNERPVALYQRSLEDMAFSGSAVSDPAHTVSGTPAAEPDMVLAFTSTGRGECLAYSRDRGRSFQEYAGNPVLSHIGRDPKIIWYAPQNKWVMIVYEEVRPHPNRDEQLYVIYDSPDLINWTRRSQLSNLYECPELFDLPLDGDPANTRWIIYGARQHQSRSMCLIGQFDGRSFTPEYENETAHYGPAFYAAQIFTNAPDNRRIMIGWLSGASYPDMPFSQGMTVPLELSLRSTPSGPRLMFYPVQELETLRSGPALSGRDLSFADANDLLADATAELLDIELLIEPAGPLTLDLRGHEFTLDPDRGNAVFAGVQGSYSAAQTFTSLRVLLDRSVTEIFVNQGEAAFAAMTISDYPSAIRLHGTGRVERITVQPLRSIWP